MSQRNRELIPSFSRPASRVMIRKVARYEEDLFALIYESLREFPLPVKAKTVLLKPNLVGLDPQGVMNTHPAVIAATRESFLKLGAARVLIGDGPAMDRDTQAILESVRLKEFSGKLGDDFLVSMPKLKTHHWAGVTLSLKNMFGIVPGSCYGWPKNVLHWAGIDRSILDINAAARPDFAIVDGILGMEGNGPIQGTPKAASVLLFGDDPVAVDATACRVMGLLPDKVDYLSRAGTMLGHVEATKIQQLGEAVDTVRTRFAVLSEVNRLVA